VKREVGPHWRLQVPLATIRELRALTGETALVMREAAAGVGIVLACRVVAGGARLSTNNQMDTPAGPRRAPRRPRLFKRTVLRHTLTKHDLEAGGRPRDPLEVSLTLSQDEAAFFPAGPFPVQTDDGVAFEASVTGKRGKGTPPRHLRADPATRFGEWLKGRKGARVGDEVEVIARSNGLFRFLHVPHGRDTTPDAEAPVGS
jgi:hypothetical protein